MEHLSNRGYAVAITIWFIIVFSVTLSTTCVEMRNCGGEDMVLSAVMGVGFLAPAYYGTLLILGPAFKSLIEKGDD